MQIASVAIIAGSAICFRSDENRFSQRQAQSLDFGECSRTVTVASSTSIPMASDKPPNVIILIVLPVKLKTVTANKIASGIDVQTTMTERQLPKKQENHQRYENRRKLSLRGEPS